MGSWNFDSGIFTEDDGVQFKSIGVLDFGNNDMWEVMAPVVKPPDDPSPFAGTVRQTWRIYMGEHGVIEDYDDICGISLAEFMAEYVNSPHLIEILLQLGEHLKQYAESK